MSTEQEFSLSLRTLENFNTTSSGYDSPIQVGAAGRPNTYVKEVLMLADLDELSNVNIISAKIELNVSVVSLHAGVNQPYVRLYEQNKGNHSSSAEYNTYAETAWNNQIGSVDIEDGDSTGTYTIESTSDFVDLVQDWVDGEKDNEGLILGSGQSITFHTQYVQLSEANLILEYESLFDGSEYVYKIEVQNATIELDGVEYSVGEHLINKSRWTIEFKDDIVANSSNILLYVDRDNPAETPIGDSDENYISLLNYTYNNKLIIFSMDKTIYDENNNNIVDRAESLGDENQEISFEDVNNHIDNVDIHFEKTDITFSKSASIENPDDDEITLFRASKNVRLTKISAVLSGDPDGSVSFNIVYASDRNSPTPSGVWPMYQTLNIYDNFESTVFDNNEIDIGDWVWVSCNQTTDVDLLFHVTVEYELRD